MEIKEDYCNFETAKLLKEKGFDAETNTYYYATSEYTKSEMYKSHNNTNWNNNEYYYSAPTHQMAMKWLREVHKVFFCVHPDYPISKNYMVEFYDKSRPSGCFGNYSTYEEAIEAALKYTLKNLI